jgi:hypothetical protein
MKKRTLYVICQPCKRNVLAPLLCRKDYLLIAGGIKWRERVMLPYKKSTILLCRSGRSARTQQPGSLGKKNLVAAF